MATLVWDEPLDRTFEAGVDRGVLYFDDGTLVVSWNGLLSVSQTFREDLNEAYFFDGEKYVDFSTLGDFSGQIKAYTFPDLLSYCDGSLVLGPGITAENQDTKDFSMSYRTKIGNSEDGIDHGYKLHVLYNITAVPTNINHQTLGDNPDAIEFGWDITTRPEKVEGYRATSHLIIDSTLIDPDVLSSIEDILYGTEDDDPILLSLSEFVAYVSGDIIIHDNGDGTWTATGDSPFVSVSDGIITLTGVSGSYLTPDTYELYVNG